MMADALGSTSLIRQFLGWYLVVQVLALVALPLTLRLLARLPDRGYSAAKIAGILLVSVVLWLGYSYGLMRHDTGSAWLSVAVVAVLSAVVGRAELAQLWRERRLPVSWRYVVLVEVLFLAGFALWALVRAYDPAINHTEQPMDLMFMNSIWSSAAFPPQDAWLAGYPVSYYYLGYWLLTVLARLAGQPPEIAYNLGQANWYGLLLIGSFGLVYNLLALPRSSAADDTTDSGPSRSAALGGLLAAGWVAVAGNLQITLEWLYAHGVKMDALLRWVDVRNFPENAAVTNQWFIDWGWWWWRSSRVLRDVDLTGNHIEVIDEFPAFSYVLGDNHPHVMAMPVVLLVITLALAYFLPRRSAVELTAPDDAEEHPGEDVPTRSRWTALLPEGGGWGALVMVLATGALIFLNTWDFPPYWLLLVAVALLVGVEQAALRGARDGRAWRHGVTDAVLVGATLVAGTVVIYLPYFLTAQSQAGGLLPNLFNPTRLPQFLLMFGAALPALLALLLLVWPALRPDWSKVGLTLLAVYGVPLVFLGLITWLGTSTGFGREALGRVALPAGATSHVPFVLARWTSQPWTFLLTGGLLALVLALVWQQTARVAAGAPVTDRGARFALLLAGIGLLLVFAPEWIYLRDNFGTRMNTVFKFYYQAWLLFALAGSYAVVAALRRVRTARGPAAWSAAALAGLTLVLVTASLLFTPAGAYSKTNGFAGTPTFDGVAYVREQSPAEYAAALWLRTHAAPDALVVEGKGASYRAETNRMSTLTGRPTLLGWDGHESQWRGRAYGRMAAGRPEALDLIYRSGGPLQIQEALARWDIDYVYVGPTERAQYGLTPATEARIAQVMDLVFDQGDVRIYRRRGT
ncbi:MAG: hypothetical protein H6644_14825 [Caldilineaceae bacterium]|nr:hypothetical protein [Caldilineaceae bacterium]